MVDVVVIIFDLVGKKIVIFDGLGFGLEYFFFEMKVKGVFVIEVSFFKEKEGWYFIVLKCVELVVKEVEKCVD